MPAYAAFLRGINVGGHRLIPMAALRASLTRIGLQHVRTYIQSGNVLFHSTKRSVPALRSLLETHIATEYGHDVVVMVRRPAELARIIDDLPFDGPADTDEWRTYVALLVDAPAATAARDLLAASTDNERFVVRGADVYSRMRRVADIRRPVPLEKILQMPATVRNWNTMVKVRGLAQ